MRVSGRIILWVLIKKFGDVILMDVGLIFCVLFIEVIVFWMFIVFFGCNIIGFDCLMFIFFIWLISLWSVVV